jgi:predicted membrane GTPase involved in stress response
MGLLDKLDQRVPLLQQKLSLESLVVVNNVAARIRQAQMAEQLAFLTLERAKQEVAAAVQQSQAITAAMDAQLGVRLVRWDPNNGDVLETQPLPEPALSITHAVDATFDAE